MPTAPNLTVSKAVPQFALPVSVIALKAEAYSPEDKTVLISLTTKYSGVERTYSVPLDCFYDLAADLQKLNALTDIID
ncbi:MAG TPA: hypothetical protein VKG24_22065 [Pseudolabrys sp.]|jgi:hypothetical protein|nr:hypothetical protein [Pseudolabrys sp.]